MKLLLDQNLSYKIATLLKNEYPGSVAAREVVVDLLRQNVQRIRDFEADYEVSLLVLGK